MQLVPLSTDGRVRAVPLGLLPPGSLRVALRATRRAVTVETLGPDGPRRVGRLTAADAAQYGPVLARLAARGHVGTCPARVARRGEDVTLTLHLGSSATCTPRDAPCSSSLPTARTIKLRAAAPKPRSPQRPPHPVAVTRPRRTRGPDVEVSPPPRRPPLPARPPARMGEVEDVAPRLTPLQLRRVLWTTLGLAAVLLLAATVQHVVSAPLP